MKIDKLGAALKRVFKFLLGVFTRRLWLKIISLVLALILWTYIISTNTSLTRTKQFYEVSVESGATSELSAKNLALATDIQSKYKDAISVTVEVPQSQYSLLGEENITLIPDFSAVNAKGTHEVPLSGISTYGTVTRLSPATILVDIEDQMSRNVTAELELINENKDDYWYDVSGASLNPRTITVTGPSSLIETVSRAVIPIDVAAYTSSVRRGFTTLTLKDQDGDEMSKRLLTLSTTGVMISLDIYPRKELRLTVNEALLPVPEGYTIESVSFEPATIKVAAGSDYLNATDTIQVDVPAELTDVSGTHNVSVHKTANIKDYSSTEVAMTVVIRPAEKENADE